MNFKIILIFLLCLIFLINPVFGNSEVDDPKNYRLTEIPYGYKLDSEGHTSNEDWKYYQMFSTEDVYDEYEYRSIYTTIYSLSNDESARNSLETLKGNFERSNEVYYSEITEIHGIGDKAYRITNIDFSGDSKTERLYFSKNHIVIAVNSGDASDLMTFAKLYDNKITSVLDNAPQMFATIELEKGSGATYHQGESFMYYITLSDDANVLIESQVNNDIWDFVSTGFYKKGQYTLYGALNPPYGDEKLRLTATSLKGSESISTVSFISKERIVTPAPTINSGSANVIGYDKHAQENEASFLNPFIVFGIVIVMAMIINRKK